MNLLIIGSGGREHSLVWKLSQDERVNNLFCAPGNPGMREADLVDLAINDSAGLLEFALSNDIDLTIVGPELPLVKGIVDEFRASGLLIFGPTAKAAALEGSKLFAKEMMQKYSIPTAKYKSFENTAEALDYISDKTVPCVIKASGLAAGKGVLICNSVEEAEKAIKDMLVDKVFGDAGNLILIEELMEGEEASILVITDGQNHVILPSAQDHKRIDDGDEGLNTGGMGAYSPAPIVTDDMMRIIESTIVIPTLNAMIQENNPYTGVLYVGIMMTSDGPKVVEYNVRFGDPEAQAIIPLIGIEFLDLLLASAKGDISSITLSENSKSSTCIVLSSGGYPGKYENGMLITGLEGNFSSDIVIFHAGTDKKESEYITNGGRVLNIVGLGDRLEVSIKESYAAVRKIDFKGMHYRNDIGQKGLMYIRNNLT